MELLFYNGNIITMEYDNELEEFANVPEAVLIKNGVICAVGKYEEVLAQASENVVKRDLMGKCLMPGFIDAHSHFTMAGQAATCADLSECESFDDIKSVLNKHIANQVITEDTVILGFGYDHNFLAEGRHPDKTILDCVSSSIPIFILHVSAHLACANSAALQLAQINDETPNPFGGVIGRMEGSNEPSGYVEEAGMQLLQQVLLPRVKVNYAETLIKMQELYIQNGITTAQDGATVEKDWKILLAMSEANSLKLDIVAYPLMTSGGVGIMHTYGEQFRNYINRVKIGGYKVVLDGSPQGRSAWMSQPYLEGENGYCGYPWLNNEAANDFVCLAVQEEKQIMAHCNGDAASEQFINAYEKALTCVKVENKELGDLRPVMIHCQTVRNDQLDRMAKLKMMASIFVGHVWYWGDIHMRNFGPERGSHISPARDAIERGIIVNFHQDTPITKPNMMHSVWCAVNRISRNGQTIGKEQALSIYDSLKAITINAAYQYHEENEKGSIKKGKRADVVILDKSPLTIEPMDIKNIKVVETIKDGEIIYQR